MNEAVLKLLMVLHFNFPTFASEIQSATVVEAHFKVTGAIDTSEMQKRISHKTKLFAECYDRITGENKEKPMRVELTWNVEKNGRPKDVKLLGQASTLPAAMCLANRLKAVRFPKPKDRGAVQVKGEFNFSKRSN